LAVPFRFLAWLLLLTVLAPSASAMVGVGSATPNGNVVEERAGATGNLVVRYDYGTDLARMDRVGVGGGTRYYLHDGLGSVVGLTDSSGTLTDRWGYDAYGNPTRLEGSTTNPFLFNGQQYDSEEGLYFLRARYYAPQQGRFLTHDPLMGNSGDPQSLHRYLYANPDDKPQEAPTAILVAKALEALNQCIPSPKARK
jgi:RHS repeat-associated protein